MPRTTRVPGHTPLTPSPLLRRKPKVSMAAEDLAATGNATPARAQSPSSTLSPNTRLNNMVQQGTVATGGAGGGTAASIATLKSDLVMVQAEVDAMTRGNGAVELQGTLARFTPSSDERTNAETSNTLMALVLLKLNELARLHGSGPSTAPRQSRVGDLLALFRNLHSGAGSSASAPAPIVTTSRHVAPAHNAAAPTRTPSQAAGSPVGFLNVDVARGEPAPNPDIESHQHMAPAGAGASVTSVRSSASATTGGAGRAESPTTTPGYRQDGALVDSPRFTTYDSHGHGGFAPLTREGIAERARVERLEKQLAMFKYLEKSLHVVDDFDHTMRHITMSSALKDVGVDLKELMANARISPPAHTVNKQGVIKPAPEPVAAQAAAKTPKAGVTFKSAEQAGASVQSDATHDGSAPAADGDDAASTSALAPVAAAPGHSAGESLTLSGLRSLVGFQNAVLAAVVAELRELRGATSRDEDETPRPAHAPLDSTTGPQAAPKEVAELRERVRRLEAALDARSEQLASERQLHMVRHERAANVLLAERSRSTTPAGGADALLGLSSGADRPMSVLSERAASRPLSRMLMASYAHDGPADATFARTMSGLGHRPPTRSGGVTGLALPPVGQMQPPLQPGQRASTPLLATKPADLAGAAEQQYRRTIAQQQEIIRDLQQRVQGGR